MAFGNMGFVKANQITNQDTISQEDKSKLKEKILPESINDKFEIYLDDSYKPDIKIGSARSLPLVIEKPNMRLTIYQPNVSLLSSTRFDQLVNEMDEIIRLSKEFIGID